MPLTPALSRREREKRPLTPTLSRGEREKMPAALGFRLPAEWEPHEATWIGWPHNRSDWPGKFAPIPWVYGEIVRRLAPGEIVRVLVESKTHEQAARRRLGLRLFESRLDGREIVLEGGAIDANGSGTILTTEECLLDPKVQVRNPGMTRRDYERVFQDSLAASNVL